MHHPGNLTQLYSEEYLNAYIGYQVVITAIVFIVAVFVAVSLRFYARRLQNVPWGWDDGYVVMGGIFTYALIAVCLIDVYAGGVGHHRVVVEPHPEKIVILEKMYILTPIFALAAAAMPKLSIICLYLRIFNRSTHKLHRNICWITGGLVVAHWIACTIAALVACIPLRHLWTDRQPGDSRRCIDFNAYYRWQALGGIFTDLVMMILPWPVIRNMSTSKSVKISLAVTFAFGSLGLVATLARFGGFFANDSEADAPYTATILLVLTIIEPGMYMISACLLGMKPLLIRLLERLSRTSKAFLSRSADTDIPKNAPDGFRMQKMAAWRASSRREDRPPMTHEEDGEILVTHSIGVEFSSRDVSDDGKV